MYDQKSNLNHVVAENDLVSVRYSHFVKNNNPREEMLWHILL
jgi:hypothetical protein